MEKNITITVYLENGKQYHSSYMTSQEAKLWISKYIKKDQAFEIWDWNKNEEITRIR